MIDEGFGLSITVDVTDQSIQDKISAWFEANMIGKEKDADKGKPKFKDYKNEKTGEVTKQFAFRYNDFTKFAGLNGLKKEDIGFQSVIDLVSNAFSYDNKFGKGVGHSLSAVLVKSAGKTGSDADMALLMGSQTAPSAAEEEYNNGFKHPEGAMTAEDAPATQTAAI